jgi:hypothetical protein
MALGLYRLTGAALCAVAISTSAYAANGAAAGDFCKSKLYLAGGYEPGSPPTQLIRQDPSSVQYTVQWSNFHILQVSPTMDWVYIQAAVAWTQISQAGQNQVFVGGLPPLAGVGAAPFGGGGNYGGVTIPTGYGQVGVDEDFFSGPQGAAFITLSGNVLDATNLRWENMPLGPLAPGGHPYRLRLDFSMWTTDDALLAWMAATPTTNLICEVHLTGTGVLNARRPASVPLTRSPY